VRAAAASSADDLLAVLGGLDLPPVPAEVLVAADTGDDAAVYRLPSGDAVVATLDFFTPIVDDPYDWGRIAATNALSDVYAMGGTPFLALNIVSWPIDDLPREELGRVLQGGIDAAREAGVAVLGGHSITDPEPKYGMVVLGLPRNMDGSYGPAALKVREFIARLKDVIVVPIKTWDERLTSAQANRLLIQANVRREQRKEKVDKTAAAILLQSYLDALAL
jgi:hypothetical protein